ncbi:MAG: hypothetical protein IJM35_11320 [Bacteroidales bacterium]|nr:hypothetical protein [Bacteroidales bacterium]
MKTLLQVTSITLLAFLYGSMVRHRKQVQEDMAAIESLELHIRKSPDGYRLKEILLAQVSNLLQLANKYHSEDRRSVKDELFKKFEINLNSLKDDTKVYTLLEDVLNSCHDSVMEHLHKEYPTMKPKTSNVLAMMFLGFRYEDICLLTRTHSKSSLMSFAPWDSTPCCTIVSAHSLYIPGGDGHLGLFRY